MGSSSKALLPQGPLGIPSFSSPPSDLLDLLRPSSNTTFSQKHPHSHDSEFPQYLEYTLDLPSPSI